MFPIRQQVGPLRARASRSCTISPGQWHWLLATSAALTIWLSLPQVAYAEWGDAITPVGTTSDFTLSTAWGDFDHDGDLDIAVGNYRDRNQIYENRSGAFALYWESPDLDPTQSVAWGDMEGDGDLDLAVGNFESPSQVFRNDGGQFVLAWTTADATRRTSTIAWVDWNQDGRLDLAIANGGGFVFPQPNQLFENTGVTFTLAWETPDDEIAITYSMAWGDWDGDGDLDPVFGNRGLDQLYRNTGDDLQLVQTLAGSTFDTVSVAWGDWDGDQDLDLALGNQIDAVDIIQVTPVPNQIYRNEPGGFVEAWRSPELSVTASVAWGDMDGDGDLDLAVGNSFFSDDEEPQGIQLYKNQAATLTLAWHTTGHDTAAQSVAWGDMDNDGDLDLLSGEAFRPNRIYENSANTLWSAQSLPAIEPGRVIDMAWGDSDSDGDLDLAVSESANLRVYTNQEGQFTLDWSLPAADLPPAPFTPIHAKWGDWNGDGQPDLAISIAEQLAVYENTGGNFTRIWQSDAGSSTISSLDWGDWDGDGDLDLAVGRAASPNQVYANLTTGFTPVWAANDSKQTLAVAWGDMDHDGDLDLAVGNGGDLDSSGTTLGDRNQIFENTGGNLIPAWESTDLGQSSSVAWADVDGDGDLDLAVGNWIALGSETAAETNYLYVNTGSSFFARPLPGPIMPTFHVAWGDGDGDGDLDLAVANDGSGGEDKLQLFRNDAGVLNLAWTENNSAVGATTLAWGDADNDGDLDLAAGSYLRANRLYVNHRVSAARLAVNPLVGSIQRPEEPALRITSAAVSGPLIPISYTLRGPELHSVVSVQGYYSLNGGGQWFPATPTPATRLAGLATGTAPIPPATDLPATDFHLFLPVLQGGNRTAFQIAPVPHQFVWDAAQDGLTGDYPTVSFRLDIFSGYGPFVQAKQTIYAPPFALHMPEE